jgi:hypothetical protein
MSQFQQDNVRLNPGLSGASVATDYVSAKDSHYQIVKLDFGDENSFSQVSNQNPLPVNIQGINNTFQTLPVAGNTEGGPILVTGTFGFTGTITGDQFRVTIDGFTTGLTFGVQNVDGTTLDISGSSVIISDVVLPSSLTMGSRVLGTDTPPVVQLPGFSCATGIKIKNFAGLTQSGAIITVSNSDYSSGGATANAYLLLPGEEVFIELDDIDRLRFSALVDPFNATREFGTFTYQAS